MEKLIFFFIYPCFPFGGTLFSQEGAVRLFPDAEGRALRVTRNSEKIITFVR